MDDLFEQLKAAPPVNKTSKAGKLSNNSSTFMRSFESNEKVSSPRRESMPPPMSPLIFKTVKVNKSRSMSPPKFGSAGHHIKPFKVMLGRKQLSSSVNSLPTNKKRSPAKEEEKSAAKKDSLIELFRSPIKLHGAAKTTAKKTSTTVTKASITSKTTPIKTTPTKAQQKLFSTNPSELPQAQNPEKKKYDPKPKSQKEKQQKLDKLYKSKSKQVTTKRCLVRLPRQDLKKLQKETKKLRKVKPQNGNLPECPIKKSANDSLKRKSINSPDSTPAKRGRPSNSSKENKTKTASPPGKRGTGFFIKLNTTASSWLGAKKTPGKKNEKSQLKHAVQKSPKPNKPGNHSFVALSSAKSTSPTSLTGRIKPTKFTRTQLIKAFGKRVFKSFVKIERCRHPLMLIFDSNAKARKQQAKGNKSKNLSVSFREQVEIFGSSGTDTSDDEDDVEYKPKGASSKKAAAATVVASANSSAPPTPLVTPARLKKVENGKVIDDIEFDPALFLDPSAVLSAGIVGNSSTPYSYSPGRKRREKKSFSPLKGDAAPSPRKEQFKLANEKLPPSGLRRMNMDDVDEDDDEDDDCEYIVPIEIPQRRTSRANSINAAESSGGSFVSAHGDDHVDENTSKDTNAEEAVAKEAVVEEAVAEVAVAEERVAEEAVAEEITDEPLVNDELLGKGLDKASTKDIESTIEAVEESLIDDNSDKVPKLTRIDGSPTPTLTPSAQLLESCNDFTAINASKEDVISETNSDEKDASENDAKKADATSNATANTTSDHFTLFVEEDSQNLTRNSTMLSDVAEQEDIIENILKERIGDISKDINILPLKFSQDPAETATVTDVGTLHDVPSDGNGKKNE